MANQINEGPAPGGDGPGTDQFAIFAADAWIPDWNKSIPGKELALHSVPTECVIHLEPDPHIAIEIHLEGQTALRHSPIVSRQGEYVPMQFDGLAYSGYPIRGNRYATHTWSEDNFYLDAKFRLLDKGFRTLRLTKEPSYSARAFIINLAIDNPDPIQLALGGWLVELSPRIRDHNDNLRFLLSHSINITHENGSFSDTDLATFMDRLRLILSVINMTCCEIVPVAAYDQRSMPTGYMIHQLHCDGFDDQTLFDPPIWNRELYQRIEVAASSAYHRIVHSPPHYVEGLDLLVCDSQNAIPSFWTVLEKTCGSGPKNVRTALRACVESIKIPSEHRFLHEALNVRRDADFIDVFYEMRNHLAHERNKIAKGQPVPPEAHTIVNQLAELLAWSKVLTDLRIESWVLHEARAAFADWEFEYDEGQPTILKRFQADGTYNAMAAIRRLVRGGETPGKVSTYFETPSGQLFISEPRAWPNEMPPKRDGD